MSSIPWKDRQLLTQTKDGGMAGTALPIPFPAAVAKVTAEPTKMTPNGTIQTSGAICRQSVVAYAVQSAGQNSPSGARGLNLHTASRKEVISAALLGRFNYLIQVRISYRQQSSNFFLAFSLSSASHFLYLFVFFCFVSSFILFLIFDLLHAFHHFFI